MKLILNSSGVALLLLVLALQLCFADGKQHMGERAKAIREKKHTMHKPRAIEQRAANTTEFQYLTNKTERRSTVGVTEEQS
jgi:hypothetical protein